MASGSTDNTVKVWDVTDRELEHTFSGHTGAVNSIAWSPNGSKIASASADHTVKIWSVDAD